MGLTEYRIGDEIPNETMSEVLRVGIVPVLTSHIPNGTHVILHTIPIIAREYVSKAEFFKRVLLAGLNLAPFLQVPDRVYFLKFDIDQTKTQ